MTTVDLLLLLTITALLVPIALTVGVDVLLAAGQRRRDRRRRRSALRLPPTGYVGSKTR